MPNQATFPMNTTLKQNRNVVVHYGQQYEINLAFLLPLKRFQRKTKFYLCCNIIDGFGNCYNVVFTYKLYGEYHLMLLRFQHKKAQDSTDSQKSNAKENTIVDNYLHRQKQHGESFSEFLSHDEDIKRAYDDTAKRMTQWYEDSNIVPDEEDIKRAYDDTTKRITKSYENSNIVLDEEDFKRAYDIAENVMKLYEHSNIIPKEEDIRRAYDDTAKRITKSYEDANIIRTQHNFYEILEKCVLTKTSFLSQFNSDGNGCVPRTISNDWNNIIVDNIFHQDVIADVAEEQNSMWAYYIIRRIRKWYEVLNIVRTQDNFYETLEKYVISKPSFLSQFNFAESDYVARAIPNDQDNIIVGDNKFIIPGKTESLLFLERTPDKDKFTIINFLLQFLKNARKKIIIKLVMDYNEFENIKIKTKDSLIACENVYTLLGGYNKVVFRQTKIVEKNCHILINTRNFFQYKLENLISGKIYYLVKINSNDQDKLPERCFRINAKKLKFNLNDEKLNMHLTTRHQTTLLADLLELEMLFELFLNKQKYYHKVAALFYDYKAIQYYAMDNKLTKIVKLLLSNQNCEIDNNYNADKTIIN